MGGTLRATALNFVNSAGQAALSWDWGSGLLTLNGYGYANALVRLIGTNYYTYFQLTSDSRSYQFAVGGSSTGGYNGMFYIYDESGAGVRLQISPTLVDLIGRTRAGTLETASGNKWQLGGYAAG